MNNNILDFIFPIGGGASTATVFGLIQFTTLVDVIIAAGLGAITGLMVKLIYDIFLKDNLTFQLRRFKNWCKKFKK